MNDNIYNEDYPYVDDVRKCYEGHYEGSVWDKTLQHIHFQDYIAIVTTLNNETFTGFIEGFDKHTLYITTDIKTGNTNTIIPIKNIASVTYTGENLFIHYDKSCAEEN